jgi:dihydroorotase
MKTLTITRPDDWHLHIRNGRILKLVLPHTARQFARAIIMPNLKPPITIVANALSYREEILSAIPEGMDFSPLMTLYLTAETAIDEIKKASACEFIHAFKLYPSGVTTNSDSGVANIRAVYPLFAAMEKLDIPLLIHGESTNEQCDIFDRERVFIDTELSRIVESFPGLRIVLEHVTTSEAVQFVLASSAKIAATITPQHLLFNRNALLAGGIHPHNYCLPVLKREMHRIALVNAASSGNPKFFLGTDSAPHSRSTKENACGCAGCFSAPLALELYTEVFERVNALDKLEAFASFFGADFYRLPRNTGTISLQKQSWTVPECYSDADLSFIPLMSNEEIGWKLL